MSGLEIFLLLCAGIIIAATFVFSEKFDSKKENQGSGSLKLDSITKDVVKNRVEIEIDNLIDEKIDKAEIALDKITNEKIMAVGDYSDGVLKKIEKNHEEVMFLYDMLIEKEKGVKNVVRDVEAVKKSVEIMAETKLKDKSIHKEVNNTDNEIQKEANKSGKIETSDIFNDFRVDISDILEEDKNADDKKEKIIKNTTDNIKTNDNIQTQMDIPTSNNNEKILGLYKEGKSLIEIARTLGLGMGEVKLVIDLYNKGK